MVTINTDRIDEHMRINEGFARQQGLDDGAIEKLRQVYILMGNVLDHPESYEDPVARVTELEYAMQEGWRFPRDAKFHRYQMYIKGCTCPKMDNAELVGYTEDRYSVSDCPWHWKGEKQ